MAAAAITAPPMRKGFRCSSESVPEAAASSPAAAPSASVAPSWGGGCSASGAAGKGSALRGGAGSLFSDLDAALGAEAPDLALASMDSGLRCGLVRRCLYKVSSVLHCGNITNGHQDYLSKLSSDIMSPAM